jgi:hypothetical protein
MLSEGKGAAPTPVRATGLHTLETAIQLILTRLYAGFVLPHKPVTQKQPRKIERNAEIIARHAAGEGLSNLAREFGLTPQRVYQIVHRKRR